MGASALIFKGTIMANTKPVGVAFSDPELTAGTTITGAVIDSTSKVASNIANGFSTSIQGATIATTGNSDAYVIAQTAGTITSAIFSGVDALTANDTNYITFSITNLGQAGAGSAALLAATDANTTKATGGTALAANTARSLTLNGTAANLVVASGDRLRIRAAASGTLANTVTFPTYRLNFTVA
jgi:hypothetical protein